MTQAQIIINLLIDADKQNNYAPSILGQKAPREWWTIEDLLALAEEASL